MEGALWRSPSIAFFATRQRAASPAPTGKYREQIATILRPSTVAQRDTGQHSGASGESPAAGAFGFLVLIQCRDRPKTKRRKKIGQALDIPFTGLSFLIVDWHRIGYLPRLWKARPACLSGTRRRSKCARFEKLYRTGPVQMSTTGFRSLPPHKDSSR